MPRSLSKQRELLMNKLRKRRVTLFKKAHKLAMECDVDVYVLVRCKGRYFSYRSLDVPAWPPSPEDVDMSYPLPEQLTPQDFTGLTSIARETNLPCAPDAPGESDTSENDGTLQRSGFSMSIPNILNDADDENRYARGPTRLATVEEETEDSLMTSEIPCIYELA